MQQMIDLELDLARNESGNPIGEDLRTLIRHYLLHPSMPGWDALSGQIIMKTRDGFLSFWAAMVIVDPTFQNSRARLGPNCFEPWRTYPSPEMLLEALRFATH